VKVALVANPRRGGGRKKRKAAKRKEVQHKRAKAAAPKKTTRRRKARKTSRTTEKTMAKRKTTKRRRKSGKRKQTPKQRAASKRNLARGRRAKRKAASPSRKRRRRVASAAAPRRRRRKAASGGTRKRRTSARRGKKHTKWKSIKGYSRKRTVRGHRRRTNPGFGEALALLGIGAVGGALGILAKRGGEKFLPVSLNPTARGAIYALGGTALGLGSIMLGAPTLGIGFAAGMIATGGDQVATEVLGPTSPALPQGAQTAAFAMGPAVGAIVDMGAIRDTQIEAVVDASELGAIYDGDEQGGFLEFGEG